MCGIAGFIDLNKKMQEPDVAKMIACIAHRGPDGEGVYFTETEDFTLGLGHKRLSIIDLSAAGKCP